MALELNLIGRTALVTGGSRGIGRAIAAAFSESGANVMIASRKAEGLAAAARDIPGDVATYQANAGDPQAAEACVEACLGKFGRLDVLVNNAATNPFYGPLVDIDEGAFDKTVQVNLRGPLFWTQAAWRRWMHDNPGVIINVSSGGSIYVEDNTGIYNITKAALNRLTVQLAAELAPTRVVGIAPGLTKTDMSQALVEAFGDRMAKLLPARRLGEPEDIAALAVFLASDHAGYITGETYFVDGGIGAMPLNLS